MRRSAKRIWRGVFPAADAARRRSTTRSSRGCNVAGGNIRNIALNAAFLAAEAGEPVGMSHLLHAARSEAAEARAPLTGRGDAGVGMKRIVLHVENLALRGIPRGECDAFVDSLRGGLERRLAAPGAANLLSSRGDRVHLDMPSAHVTRIARPRLFGARVAGAIARGLKS